MAQLPTPDVVQHATPTRSDRFRESMLSFGVNIDQINLYARLKDVYKVFEAAAQLITVSSTAAMMSADKNDPRIDRYAYRAGLGADLLNTAVQLTLSGYTAWIEKGSVTRTYSKLVSEELGLSRKITFNDLKKSSNPEVQGTVRYYENKANWRWIPDMAGLIRLVPLAAKGVDKVAGTHSYDVLKPIEKVPGITVGTGAKVFTFMNYFAHRKTGAHYEYVRIWNKTEGNEAPNRALNQNTNPGEYITHPEIAALYEASRVALGQPQFTRDDPLTSRLFEQVASMLNHAYMPKLYDATLTDAGKGEQLQDLQGTNLTHSRLVELFSRGGIDINDAVATSIRLEVMARQGVQAFKDVSEELKQIPRPHRASSTSDDFNTAIVNYVSKLNEIGKQRLGEAWPPSYVTNRISKDILRSYREDNQVADVNRGSDNPALQTRMRQAIDKPEPELFPKIAANVDQPEMTYAEKVKSAERPQALPGEFSQRDYSAGNRALGVS